MGVYYVAFNHTRRERLDPEKVGGGCPKYGSVIGGSFANLFTFVMLTRWGMDKVEIAGDPDPGPWDDFVDITYDQIDGYNRQAQTAEPIRAYRDAYWCETEGKLKDEEHKK